MNLKKRLRHLAIKSGKLRQYGKTTLVAKACKELQGVLIAASKEEAKDFERKFNVVSKSYDVNLEGLEGPFLFDHHAIEKILEKAYNKIDFLEQEIKTKEERIANLESYIDRKESYDDRPIGGLNIED